MENGIFVYTGLPANTVPVIKIEDGLKVTVRKDILLNYLKHPTLQKHFALHIKQLDLDWYSVYFEKVS